jgi:hypothetical protein
MALSANVKSRNSNSSYSVIEIQPLFPLYFVQLSTLETTTASLSHPFIA